MPIIDRGRNFSNKECWAWIPRISIVILVATILTMPVIIMLYVEQSDFSPHAPTRITYTAHAPIYIDGNSGFTNASGVIWGSGTSSDPYIIENWDINASSSSGIWIQNSDAHFTIRNCHIYNSGSIFTGIGLKNCINGTLVENICNWNENIGIYLLSSSDNTLARNNCSNNDYGIVFDSSSNNSLINNTCLNNLYDGINYDSDSNYNRLENNRCQWNSDDGIEIASSVFNIVIKNNCSNNDYGIYVYKSSNNSLTNNTCSSNNDHGVYFYSSNKNTLSNNICNSNGYYGTDLYSSSNNTLLNNTYYDNDYGIYLNRAINNSLINNTCSSNNEYGIVLTSSSSNNEIIWNQICNNSLYGVITSSLTFDNRIWNNTFIGNNGAESVYDINHIQAYDYGTDNWWNSTDYGNYWSDWIAPDNDLNGIVDIPYDIEGSAGSKDYFPQTTAPIIPEPPIFILAGILLALFLIVRRINKKK